MTRDFQHAADELSEGMARTRHIDAALAQAASVIADARRDLDAFDEDAATRDVRGNLDDAARALSDVRHGWLPDYRRDAAALIASIRS